MPTLWCLCGHVLATQPDYLPYQGQFFAGKDDPNADRIIDALARFIADQEYGADDADDSEEKGSPEIGRHAPPAALDSGVFACERCGRLWMRTAPQASGKYLC